MNLVTDKTVEAGATLAMTEASDRSAESSQGAVNCAGIQRRSTPDVQNLMEQVVGKANMLAVLAVLAPLGTSHVLRSGAYRRVVRNGGSAGVDGVKTEEVKAHIDKNWQVIKEQLQTGKYKPKPVKGVQIPKPNGGLRQLGIPTVMDRIIQQAVYQVMSVYFEPNFSRNSYGFRPGRSAHHAILRARDYQRDGRRWVVDLDLEKFFDEVKHDELMKRIKAVIKDKMLLKLVARYLKAGMLQNGIVQARQKGTPQGGNLSPLLANIMLDDLDKELEARGHKFCRYADGRTDASCYVRHVAHRVLRLQYLRR